MKQGPAVPLQIPKLEEEIHIKEQKIEEYKGCSDVAEIYEAEVAQLREQLNQLKKEQVLAMQGSQHWEGLLKVMLICAEVGRPCQGHVDLC